MTTTTTTPTTTTTTPASRTTSPALRKTTTTLPLAGLRALPPHTSVLVAPIIIHMPLPCILHHHDLPLPCCRILLHLHHPRPTDQPLPCRILLHIHHPRATDLPALALDAALLLLDPPPRLHHHHHHRTTADDLPCPPPQACCFSFSLVKLFSALFFFLVTQKSCYMQKVVVCFYVGKNKKAECGYLLVSFFWIILSFDLTRFSKKKPPPLIMRRENSNDKIGCPPLTRGSSDLN